VIFPKLRRRPSFLSRRLLLNSPYPTRLARGNKGLERLSRPLQREIRKGGRIKALYEDDGS